MKKLASITTALATIATLTVGFSAADAVTNAEPAAAHGIRNCTIDIPQIRDNGYRVIVRGDVDCYTLGRVHRPGRLITICGIQRRYGNSWGPVHYLTRKNHSKSCVASTRGREGQVFRGVVSVRTSNPSAVRVGGARTSPKLKIR